jgi:hypothetical protein
LAATTVAPSTDRKKILVKTILGGRDSIEVDHKIVMLTPVKVKTAGGMGEVPEHMLLETRTKTSILKQRPSCCPSDE